MAEVPGVNTLFISDLHLDARRPDITACFLDFLGREAARASELYVLGDLFEFWMGDDDPDPGKRRIVAALSELTRSGTRCRIMHGNRDFLLGRRFCSETGCELIDDRTVTELYGRGVLLLHGDVLCTDDHSYQRLRRIVRSPVVQRLFLSLPLRARAALAEKIRTGSRMHIDRSEPTIMDVNRDSVLQTFAAHGIDLMVHGHTHRPGVHRYQLGGAEKTRIVLGDWHAQGSVLRWTAEGYELAAFPLA